MQSCISFTFFLKTTDSFRYVLSTWNVCKIFWFFYTIEVTTMPVPCIIIKYYKMSHSPLIEVYTKLLQLNFSDSLTSRIKDSHSLLSFFVFKVKVAETNYLRGLICGHPWGRIPLTDKLKKVILWSLQANKAGSVCKSQSSITPFLWSQPTLFSMFTDVKCV